MRDRVVCQEGFVLANSYRERQAELERLLQTMSSVDGPSVRRETSTISNG